MIFSNRFNDVLILLRKNVLFLTRGRDSVIASRMCNVTIWSTINYKRIKSFLNKRLQQQDRLKTVNAGRLPTILHTRKYHAYTRTLIGRIIEFDSSLSKPDNCFPTCKTDDKIMSHPKSQQFCRTCLSVSATYSSGSVHDKVRGQSKSSGRVNPKDGSVLCSSSRVRTRRWTRILGFETERRVRVKTRI